MRRLQVSLDKNEGRITIENDGKCVPVVMHSIEKVYLPELVFGHLLTGSNFDDSSKLVIFIVINILYSGFPDSLQILPFCHSPLILIVKLPIPYVFLFSLISLMKNVSDNRREKRLRCETSKYFFQRIFGTNSRPGEKAFIFPNMEKQHVKLLIS